MRLSLPLMVSPAMAIGLTAAIAIILFAANFTITNAQQQQLTSQPAATLNGTTFQSIEDGFRVQVPQGWVVHDMENTGFTLLEEVMQGYGILAQLCPEEQQQQTLRNVGGSTSSSCEGSEGDVIYIVRYPSLGARLELASDDITTISNNTIDHILSYQIQKLQEVGYRDIQILNSTDTIVTVGTSTEAGISNNTVPAATVPAKLVEMTYSTNFAPNEIRTGLFILTATNTAPGNLGEITGYSIFYEGAADQTAEETTASGSLPSPTTAAIGQVFGSFELITAQEVVQAEAAEAAEAAQTEQTQETDETNDDGDTTQDDGNNDNDNNDNDNNDNDNNDNDNNSGSNADNCDGVSVGGTSAADDYDCTPDANNNNADSDNDNNDNDNNSGSNDYDGGTGDNDGA
jgi:hypothetical protein